MTRLSAFIESADILGPGLPDWPHATDVLTGRARYAHVPTELPPPADLPSVECRRTGPMVKLALAVGHEAVTASGHDAAVLATIFSPPSGDDRSCNAICETPTGDDHKLSPMRFHNSIHNVPAGYRNIAMHTVAPSDVLCAYDGNSAAGLLDGFCQIAIDAASALVIAYDGDYLEPLSTVHPVLDPFTVALVLAPEAGPHTLAHIGVALTDTPLAALARPGFETLWHGSAVARALSLLEALTARRAGRVVLEYLHETRVQVDIAFDTS